MTVQTKQQFLAELARVTAQTKQQLLAELARVRDSLANPGEEGKTWEQRRRALMRDEDALVRALKNLK